MTAATNDHRISLSGTIGFHAVLLVLLAMLSKTCDSVGGGGGTGGMGNSELVSLDIAAFGSLEDGLGDEVHEAAAESFDQPSEEAVAMVTDELGTDTPIKENKPTPTPTPTPKPLVPKDNKPKPEVKDNKPKENKDLSKAIIGLSNSGKGNTSGTGEMGNPEGKVDKGGILNGSGTPGEGGGEGGGQGGGIGGGKGSGFSPFSGPARSLISAKPDDVATDDGIIIVDLCIDRFGNVTSVSANAGKSKPLSTSTPNWYSNLSGKAENAVKKLKFNVNADAPVSQCGTYKITYDQSK